MQILQPLKRVAKLVFDGEIFSLAWVTAANSLKRPSGAVAVKPPEAPPEPKKASAVNTK
jgi:hypothetical protein